MERKLASSHISEGMSSPGYMQAKREGGCRNALPQLPTERKFVTFP
jgi:hypothetical protein